MASLPDSSHRGLNSPGKGRWRRALPWAFYDWANSAFATTVMAGFFPIFLKDYWTPAGTAETVSSFRLGMVNSVTAIVVALMAPMLGAMADRGNTKKKLLLFFAALGVVMAGGLHFVAQGHWGAALCLYFLAGIGFFGANIFYDALLINVAEEKDFDAVSALGFALGYLGGGLLFAFNVMTVLNPEKFGLANSSEAVRQSFLLVAIWWAVFSLPLILWVKEPKSSRAAQGWRESFLGGFRQLRDTAREIRTLRPVLWFLLGYWLYIDGVGTIVMMAVDYGKSLGFKSNDLITALLITQFVGFPAAIAFGKIGEKLGARTGIFVGLGIYAGVAIWGFFMKQVSEFYGLAIVIGLVQGGVQALSRSLYARLLPPEKSGEFFGFYNMLGKFAAVLGPALMAVVGLATGNPRWSILSIIVLFLGGAAFLRLVKVPAAVEAKT